MDSVLELNESERPGGAAFERAYWLLLSNAIVDSPRDLWRDEDQARGQAYLERYAQPWWEALQARFAEDGLQGEGYLGGDPMYSSMGWDWTVARFWIVRPDGLGDFGWNLATARSQRRRELRAAYGATLKRARRRQRARLARLLLPWFRREENPDTLGRAARLRTRLASLIHLRRR